MTDVNALLQEIEALKQQVETLQNEKHDLEVLIDITAKHSDAVQEQLFDKTDALEAEKSELEMLLDLTTQHSDAVEEQLHEQAEHALRESERRLRQFMEAVPVGIYVADAQGTPYYLNQTARKILNLPLDHTELSAAKALDYLKFLKANSKNAYPDEQNPINKALKGASSTVDDMEIATEGQRIPLETIASPIFDHEGNIIFAIASFQDISDRKRAEAERIRFTKELERLNTKLKEKVKERTEELALANEQVNQLLKIRKQAETSLKKANTELNRLTNIDSQTLVANRRRFQDFLMQEWKKNLDNQNPMGVILCDIDYFNTYQEQQGKQQSNECLTKVAQAIERAVELNDLVAHYEAEEFVIVLPETDLKTAQSIAANIQKEIFALRIPHPSSDISRHITLSMGVAAVQPKEDTGYQTLVEMADQALQEAHQQGHNRFVIYQASVH